MINVANYLDDGANWQAQCILAYIRRFYTIAIESTWDDKRKAYKAEIQVGRLENLREQGYVFSLQYGKVNANYWVYEHRNSDEICIKKFEGFFVNTPIIDQIPMKDKYDYTIAFKYGDIVSAAYWILEDMRKEICSLTDK